MTIEELRQYLEWRFRRTNSNGYLKYMKEWTSTPDIYEQTGDMLTKTATFFNYCYLILRIIKKKISNLPADYIRLLS